ncbi:hypothetical protein AVM02_14185 [Brucella anthropi]
MTIFNRSVTSAGGAGRAMDIGAGTGLGLVLAGMAVRIVRGRATGTVIAAIGIIATAIAAIMMAGGIRLQPLAQAQSSAVRLHLRRPRRSIARLLMVTAMPISSGAIIVTGPTGLRTILSSPITAPVSSAIHHTDSSVLIKESIACFD